MPRSALENAWFWFTMELVQLTFSGGKTAVASGRKDKMTVAVDEIENPLLSLTAKQREVLDLLIQHKTSKEISRQLGISPHTVDQRIMLARAKLGVATRGEVAQAYRRLVETYEQPVYGLSDLGFPPLPASQPYRDDTDVGPSSNTLPQGDEGLVRYRVLPEMFDGPYGTLMRLGYIAAVTVFLILIVLGGLTMFAQLSSMLDR